MIALPPVEIDLSLGGRSCESWQQLGLESISTRDTMNENIIGVIV